MKATVGTISGKTLWTARLVDGYIHLAVDARDQFDESRIVRVHLSDAPGLIGTLSDLVNNRLNSAQQERTDYASAVRGAVQQAAIDAGMELK